MYAFQRVFGVTMGERKSFDSSWIGPALILMQATTLFIAVTLGLPAAG